ncbi:MAG: amidase [Polyangiaceae bacterium]
MPEHVRGDIALHNRPVAGRPPRSQRDENLPLPKSEAWPPTSSKIVAAYASGALSPVKTVENCLRYARDLAQRKPTIGPLTHDTGDVARNEARASEARYERKQTLGALDGVPVVIKEETAVKGLPCRGGTSFFGEELAERDATIVARLRAAGAIVIGISAMTEYGMSPLGQNAQRAMPKNPHNDAYVAGGSSTGSGVAVATGLVPFALGCDGGGSIRIPAAMCGVFGIKPTWGRVSRTGDIFTGSSVAHLGPLASSTEDLARVLEVIGAADPEDEETRFAPAIPAGSLIAACRRGVRGLRIAVDERQWQDASPAIQKAGRDALAALEREGAELVTTRVDMLRHAAAIGYGTIGMEARGALRDHWARFADRMSPDLQVVLGSLSEVYSTDYIDGQRLRAGLRREVARLFGDVDLLALPSTVSTATPATEKEMASGFLDSRALDSSCRFMFLGNLTGLPAASIPVGLDANRLPIGLQLVGDAYDEATVLAASAHLERIGVAKATRPAISVDLFS